MYLAAGILCKGISGAAEPGSGGSLGLAYTSLSFCDHYDSITATRLTTSPASLSRSSLAFPRSRALTRRFMLTPCSAATNGQGTVRLRRHPHHELPAVGPVRHRLRDRFAIGPHCRPRSRQRGVDDRQSFGRDGRQPSRRELGAEHRPGPTRRPGRVNLTAFPPVFRPADDLTHLVAHARAGVRVQGIVHNTRRSCRRVAYHKYAVGTVAREQEPRSLKLNAPRAEKEIR